MQVKELDVIVLTLEKVVAYTGYKRSYIYKLTHEGKIPYHKPPFGRRLFFLKSEIDEWLLSVKFSTVNDIIN